jgi:hypothetical protein
VKNITVSVSDDVYRGARIKAAERGSSVSALVADFLASLVRADSEFRRLEALQQEIFDQITEFDGSDRLGRDELHERAVR